MGRLIEWKSLFRKTKKKEQDEPAPKEMFYDISKIDATGATYRMIIGQRSNGKSYSVCRHIIENYITKGERGAYVRRWEEDITPKNISSLFDPHIDLIVELSGGKWNAISYRAKEFHLCSVDSDGTVIEKDPIAFCITASINTAEHTKGQDRGEVSLICFDEFATRQQYLKDEFVQFCNLLSSLIRNRSNTVVYMLSNTVNRYCPYFEEMGLTEVTKQEQGTIDVYTYNNKDLTVAVEYCAEVAATEKVGNKYFAFENSRLNMISAGAWELDVYPRPPYSIQDYMIRLRFYINFNGQMICGEIVNDREDLFIFFHPQTKDIKIKPKDVYYTSDFTTSRCHVHYLKDQPTNAHKLIAQLIAKKAVCFSDNECGEVIRNWLINDQNIKGLL